MKNFLFIFLFLLSAPALAEEGSPSYRAEEYLGSIKSFEADFVQNDSRGGKAAGKFYIKKPGKFLWEYTKGQPILIVSDGRQMVYYDRQLKEATYVLVKNSLAGFLARKEIKFSGDIKLISEAEDDETITVDLVQKNKPEEGALTLIFSKEPMEIKQMRLTDQAGQVTDVVFNKSISNGEINDNKFVFHDPKLSKNVWEK